MRFKTIMTVIATVLSVLILWVGYDMLTTTDSEARAEAVRQARAYECKGIAAEVLTPATHVTTGAEYTFPSACLAPGWVRDEPSVD